ncbi:MAG TPA: sulfotransferase [Allosphingosinicella sp.]|jgi:tetratricopeptide (TPR) repeat protein
MTDSPRTGGLDAALANGYRLLASDPAAAAEQAAEILRVSPNVRDALLLFAEALRRMGRPGDAERAELKAISLFASEPLLAEAARHLAGGRLDEAEKRLRPYVARRPGDVAAKAMLAEVDLAAGLHSDAEALFMECLAVVPSFVDARLGLATALFRQGRVRESLDLLDALLLADPGNVAAAEEKARTLGHLGEYEKSAAVFEEILERRPDSPPIWLGYGNVLKTIGRLEESIAAYRRALELDPASGEAWWSLANLKTVKLGEGDQARMEALLGRSDLRVEDRLHLHFALGSLLEDRGAFESSFGHYAEANRLRRSILPYDSDFTADEVSRSKRLFTPDFFERREGWGCAAPDPIFILGMPRAGSTLIEQILSSHSAVEGTSELPYIPALARGLVAERWRSGARYPEVLADLDRAQLRALGEEYLERARVHRKTGRPFFIDKMPNNWADIGFIRLILPNAKVIDARRHPLGCGFSNFKQHFAFGQAFSYSLDDLGLYYSDYVRLLAHFDSVLPGRIHRIFHERMVEDSEAEIRRLLAHLGLPFEEACLRFHENDRAVRTASAEQVRRPINREGVERWKAFEPWLGPLKAALGPLLDCYPEVPEAFLTGAS